METKRLFLLDAYALIFRAYYALIRIPRLTQSGFNTSAIFGFVNTLEEVLRKERPSHIAVCFDPVGPTFRSEAFKDYKGERESTPEDIKLSVPIIKEIVKAYGIPVVEVEGYEADDVIGTLSKKAAEKGFTVYMMTPDKDFGQLVSPNILQYKPSYRGQDFELRGEEEVCARYDIKSTSQVIDLLALMGDKIDNIPGCPGVGDKTAVKLIKEFGSVENLLENTELLKGALKKKIEENREQIIFSKFLATIKTDVPVELSFDDMALTPPDRDKLFAIFRELEFKSLAERVRKRLDGDKPSATSKAGSSFPTSLFDFEDDGEPEEPAAEATKFDTDVCSVEVVESREKAEQVMAELLTADEAGVFMMSSGENDVTATWHGTSIVVADGADKWKGWFFPSNVEGNEAAVLDFLAKGDIKKVSEQTKRDIVIAALKRGQREDIHPAVMENFEDVTLCHYLLQPDMRHNLDTLSTRYLNYEMMAEPGVGGKKSKDFVPDQLPLKEKAERCCERAMVALRLLPALLSRLEKEGTIKIYRDVEHPLVEVLADMELTGVRIDVGALDQAAAEMEQKLRMLEREIYQLAGEEFNISSPSKVGEILFDKLELDPKAKKTKTGQYSTSEDVLEKVAHKNPIVGKILEFRQLKKLITTYLTALPASINPATGRIHTNYNQTVTATGRISSSAPNLQNIPVRENEGREIRRAFIPSEGNIFLSADYSQIELRLVADFADEEAMIDAFAHDRDIHSITAAKIAHKNPEEVTADERRKAKTANFGILYGITAFGLASRLGIPRGEAKELIDGYFESFPKIRHYMTQSVENARENGYVSTPMGRRRYLPDINSKNPVVRGYAERNAINAPVQGAAADIIKVAMVRIFNRMREQGLKSKMIMQVHDELNFDVVPQELPALQELVMHEMEGAYTGRVKLTTSSGAASNWLDAH